jgi:hypothetical protein
MADGQMTADDYANLSDDEIMGMAVAPAIAGLEAPQDEGNDSNEGDDTGAEGKAEEGAPDGGDTAAVLGSPDDGGTPAAEADKGDEGAETGAGADPGKEPAKPAAEGDADKAKEPGKPDAPAVTPVDYKAAYEQIMAPFKANGKEIKLESVDEAVRLMQMGANYTKKLQALQPNLKLLKMMENNGLLDEGKLSYLIDLDKKNPAAIQKLLRESGVDPLDIDTRAEPNYKPGNYQVSDEQMTFSTTLEEVSSDPAGAQIVVAVNRTWDEQSKREIYKDPNILRVLTDHKHNGIYDKISAEMDRRRVLGTLPATMPFLNAYMSVGKELDQRGALTPTAPAQAAQNPGQQPQARIVETRTAPPKQAPNADKARAASPVSSSPKKAAPDFNPLALSDEEFMKNADLAKRL